MCEVYMTFDFEFYHLTERMLPISMMDGIYGYRLIVIS